MILVSVAVVFALIAGGLYGLLKSHEEQQARTRIRASGHPSKRVG